MNCTLYILKCYDGSYYTGTTRKPLDDRIGDHNNGYHPFAYTFTRRPVELVFAQEFQYITDAVGCERQIKGWSRRKKEALISGEFDLLVTLSKRRGGQPKQG